MTEKPFKRSVAESLLNPTGTNKHWLIDDRGIWPKAEWNPAIGTGNRIDFEFDSWRPAVIFANDPLPQEPGDLPALPFPFDPKDLAAFMLYGFGALVASHYGDWENGPNPERIADLYPLDFSKRAVKEAFEAKRNAEKIVGPYPLELDAKADRARKAYNTANDQANEREGVSNLKPGTDESKISAVASTAELDFEMEATAEAARAAHWAWLTAMVLQLLRPAPIAEPARPEPAETVAERRQRYLAWHLEEQSINPRGALKRVFDREAKQNPMADRSNIGKDIKLAREASKRPDDKWTSQLIRAGQR